MPEHRDLLAALLACLFAENIRENPMPPHRQQQLLQSVEQLLSSIQEGETGRGQEHANGTGSKSPTG